METLRNLGISLKLSTRCENKDCFRNALFNLKEGWLYVEGYAFDVDLPLVIHHGWAENEEGEIIDPTPVWAIKKGVRYFPAKKWPRAEALAAAVRKGELPLEGEVYLPEHWREVYVEATREAMGDAAAEMLLNVWKKNKEVKRGKEE